MHLVKPFFLSTKSADDFIDVENGDGKISGGDGGIVHHNPLFPSSHCRSCQSGHCYFNLVMGSAAVLIILLLNFNDYNIYLGKRGVFPRDS